MTQDEARAAELRRRYKIAWDIVKGQLAAIGQLVADDFPAPDGPVEELTRYHVDALSALGGELGRLTMGYEGLGG